MRLIVNAQRKKKKLIFQVVGVLKIEYLRSILVV